MNNENVNYKRLVQNPAGYNLTMTDFFLISGFRYCLGRRSTAVSEGVEHILVNWDSMRDTTKDLIVREINERRSNGPEDALGDKCDQDEWQLILDKYNETK